MGTLRGLTPSAQPASSSSNPDVPPALPAVRTTSRRIVAPLSRWIASASYLRRWLVLGAVIGIVAGSGAIVFYEALLGATHLFLGVIGGYHPPTPVGEGGNGGSATFARPWAIPLVVAGGALISGILVFAVAPEAEGHGTDAAISAVHNNPRGIRFRAVIVKIVASAITIGSGGSGGREGPTGQISAGFGSLLARVLDLSPSDARVAVASGIGSGIGSIFGAPLGGAVLSAEILYRDDFDVSVLMPAMISSIIGYTLFAAVEGFTPIFGYISNYHFDHPLQLLWFALIGIAGGLIGVLYAKCFYAMTALFQQIRVPRAIRPAIGGLIVGLMALEIPAVLGTGYGWVQRGLSEHLLSVPLWIVLCLPFARIIATGCSIGSGGSGGIFGPGMVIGAYIGASLWRLLEGFAPDVGHDPAPYVIVGMMCCFGSIARAPLAVLLMVAEMTGNLAILPPAMFAVGIASLIVARTDDTIYRSQPRSREDSEAAQLASDMPLLSTVPTRLTAPAPRLVISGSTTLDRAFEQIAAAHVPEAPVVDDDGSYVGELDARTEADDPSALDVPAALHDPAAFDDPPDARVAPAPAPAPVVAARAADPTAPTVRASAYVDAAFEALAGSVRGWITVLDDDRRVVGTLAVSDLVRAYRKELLAGLHDLGEPERVTRPRGTP